MTVQTSFSVDRVEATVGSLYGTFPQHVHSVIAAAAISFGLFISRRATPADAVGYGAGPEVTGSVTARGYGITLKDETRKNTTAYEANDPVRVLRKGMCWVSVEGVVTEGQTLFVRFAAGAGGSVLGAFRADADTATAVACPGVVARRTTTGAGLCLVEVNLPQ